MGKFQGVAEDLVALRALGWALMRPRLDQEGGVEADPVYVHVGAVRQVQAAGHQTDAQPLGQRGQQHRLRVLLHRGVARWHLR